jgi:hypothetical protein
MDMASAAWVNAWDDCLQVVVVPIVGKLVTAQAKAGVIIFTVCIRLTKVSS